MDHKPRFIINNNMHRDFRIKKKVIDNLYIKYLNTVTPLYISDGLKANFLYPMGLFILHTGDSGSEKLQVKFTMLILVLIINLRNNCSLI